MDVDFESCNENETQSDVTEEQDAESEQREPEPVIPEREAMTMSLDEWLFWASAGSRALLD